MEYLPKLLPVSPVVAEMRAREAIILDHNGSESITPLHESQEVHDSEGADFKPMAFPCNCPSI
jgi:hypothetical protein